MAARLLFVTENYPPDRGGMGESCDRIVRGLGRAGVRVDLVHFDRRSTAPSHRETSGGSITRVPPDADAAHTINLLWNRIQRTLDLEAVTHVVAFGGTLPLLSAPAFAAWMNRPLVTLIRGNELDAGLFDGRRRPILDDALRRASAVCTVTRTHAQKIAGLHPDIEPHVVPNGIDFGLWDATEADHARARAWRDREVQPGRVVLGIFGHLKSKKGVPLFLESLLRSGVSDRVHVLLIGEIEEATRTALEGIAHTLVPSLDRFELVPWYLAADWMVLPSHYDGFPNVLIEGAALGRPLLASAVGGMLDVLTEGETAFLFPPGDAHACAMAIARAVAVDDAERQRMGAAAAALARQRFDARDETHRYLDVLEIAQEVFYAHASDHDRSDPVARRLRWRTG
jgi:glycogen(starch) synthase